jgi:hypothetical protein
VNNKRIIEIRKRRWLLAEDFKMLRIAEAQHFVDRLGIASVFSDKLLPSLATAVYRDDLPNPFESNQRVWDFVHSLISHKAVYYGRFLKSRNTLISMKLLPCFLKLYPIPHYKSQYQRGSLSKMAKSIMDLLYKVSPLTTIEIKDRIRISKRRQNILLKNALKELQEKFLICCTGKVAQCKCRWRFSLWVPTHIWIPDIIKHEAMFLKRNNAMAKIINKFVYSVILTNEKTIAQFFRWPMNKVETVVKSMINKRLISYYNSNGKSYLFKEIL